MLKNKLSLALCGLLPLFSGCTVGPNYQPPQISTPVQYKEAQGWKLANPQDQNLRGEWWQMYQDNTLNALVEQVVLSNQNVAQYTAKYEQAAALVNQAKSGQMPSVSVSTNASRAQSGNSSPNNDFSAKANLSWELDLWGKLKRSTAENKASAQASAADLANATLSAQTTLVQNYFALRVLDKRIALYDQTIATYQRYHKVLSAKYKEGIIAKSDLTQAEQSLYSAQASREDLVWQRAQYEHAIAMLIGKMPAEFNLPIHQGTLASIPNIPLTLPSRLLERRADIASAERNLAAANEAIGIAVAGYFPDISLSSAGGYSGNRFANLISAQNLVWSLGASATQSIFDFGANKAKVKQSQAAYNAAVARYKQTILEAMQGIEDDLAKANSLAKELVHTQHALAAASETARIKRNQYNEGMIDYTYVASSEATRLSNEQNLLQLQSAQLQNSVALVNALGGGWDTTLLPE
ncbi:efflux transporter outer membrane subunit [Acinetobacter sp. MD2(2019)]|uniref:efflux transporter outer membrane subunit n=1 Tax=Acinetobacter sp. MD2(2019) TaxID=2605273 RepID=UPI002D1F8476|nr:efflux transporter outer membrane subunit [Acinetobacter sp. MD2(2019)]MEB3752860.1 efflux transporter outer membrane subunit [Acinetobacter sp. MD2(2019)]